MRITDLYGLKTPQAAYPQSISLEAATGELTSPCWSPVAPPTPLIKLWINSPFLNVKNATAGLPEAASAVKSRNIPYFLFGYSISNDLSILNVTVF